MFVCFLYVLYITNDTDVYLSVFLFVCCSKSTKPAEQKAMPDELKITPNE